MTDEIYDDIAIERAVQASFGVKLDIKEVVARKVPVSYIANATLFLGASNALYLFIQAEGNLLLSDVRSIVRHMNIDAAEFLPPHGDREYFDRIGRQKFKEIFPGKHITSDDDIRYYRTLAPYHPALIRVERVKGEIRGFHTPTKTWRKMKDYSYSRIAL